jgi:hypothetical protein
MLCRVSLAILVAFILTGCGGGHSPAPAPSPTPNQTPPPTELWSISGRVTAYGGNTGVSGAHVTADGGATPADTDADGRFKLSYKLAPTTPDIKITIAANGFMVKEFYVRYRAGARSGLDANLIRLAAPFSLDFYQQLVRGSYEFPAEAPELVWRLEDSPSVYVRTIDQKGRAIEPEVLTLVQSTLRRAVRDWSNGALSIVTLETGKETRPRTDGWIMVNITHDYKSDFCGQAYIGATDGEITLVDDLCSCGSIKIPAAVVSHEIGHALGFFHVTDRKSVMFPSDSGSCAAGILSDAEKYHAAVAYSRPRWNADPDSDDVATEFARGGRRPRDILVRD